GAWPPPAGPWRRSRRRRSSRPPGGPLDPFWRRPCPRLGRGRGTAPRRGRGGCIGSWGPPGWGRGERGDDPLRPTSSPFFNAKVIPERSRDWRHRRHINILRPVEARTSSGRERLPPASPRKGGIETTEVGPLLPPVVYEPLVQGD